MSSPSQHSDTRTVRIHLKDNEWVSSTFQILTASPVLTVLAFKQAEMYHVMNPSLLSVEPDLVRDVLQFMHTGTLTPSLVDIRGIGQWSNGRSPGNYDEELLRLTRMHLFAKTFVVRDLGEAIRVRVCGVDPILFSNEAVIESATLLFTADHSPPAMGVVARHLSQLPQIAVDPPDQLAAWILDQMAERFADMTMNNADAFWQLVDTATRPFWVPVLELLQAIDERKQ